MKRNIFQPLGFAALTITALTCNVWAQSGAGTGTATGTGSGAGSTSGSNSTSGANTGNNSGTASGGASGGASGTSGRNAGGTSGGTGTATGGLQGHGTANQQNMNMQGGGNAGGAGMMAMPGMAGMPSPLMPAPLQEASDQLFALKASQGNSAEVATSQLALAKSQDARVRQFAERMIADHTRANEELTPLGARAGVVLPKPPGVMHQATARLLQTLEGAEFDRQYLAGQVEAHENSVTLFHHQALHGQDPQLRAYANRYLPALIGHTSMVYGLARDMNVPGIGERPLAMLTSPGMMTMPGMAGMHGASATGNIGGAGAGFNQGGGQGGGSNAGSAGGQSGSGNTGGQGNGGNRGNSGSAGSGSGVGGSGSGNSSGNTGGAGTGGTGAGGTGTGGLGGTR